MGYDVVVVGGGAAGLSGALVLARCRRTVLVVDAGRPRNASSQHLHGLLSRDGVAPEDLLQRGRAEVLAFGGQVMQGVAVSAARTSSGFVVTLDDDRELAARRLLVATGLEDVLPDIPGVRERWGRDVLHCPYCHGWEIRDRAIGVIGTADAPGVHTALMFRQWSDDVLLFRGTGPAPDDISSMQLAARGVSVLAGDVGAVVIEDDRVTGVRVGDTTVPRDIVVVTPRMVARSAVLESLGLRPVPSPFGSAFESDPSGGTAVAGVRVAGNATDVSAQVVGAMAAGSRVAMALNAELVAADTKRAMLSMP